MPPLFGGQNSNLADNYFPQAITSAISSKQKQQSSPAPVFLQVAFGAHRHDAMGPAGLLIHVRSGGGSILLGILSTVLVQEHTSS